MFKQVFLNFTDAHLIVLVFLLFITTFIGALVWTILIQKKEFYDRLSVQPLTKRRDNEP